MKHKAGNPLLLKKCRVTTLFHFVHEKARRESRKMNALNFQVHTAGNLLNAFFGLGRHTDFHSAVAHFDGIDATDLRRARFGKIS